MLPSQQETKARFPRICSVCFLCHFYSCKPRGRGLGLSLPLSEGTVWAWGLSPPLLLSISGTFPCLSQHWAREGNLGMSRALPGNSLVPPHSEQGLCFVTTWGGASFPKENFPLWGSSQNRNPLCWVWDLGVWRAEVLKSYFCMAFHLLLSGTKWHQQGGKLQLLVFLGVSSFVCSVGIAPRM